MAKTVIGLMDDRSNAEKAVQELQEKGFDKKAIGIITPEGVVARDVGKKAAFGAIAGLALAASAILVPGFGPVLVAGPAATLVGGAALGALAGGMVGALTTRGVPEEEAHFYAEGIQRGGTLVTVHAETDEQAATAREVLSRHGAADVKQRAEEWKKAGWSGRFKEIVKAPLRKREQQRTQAGQRGQSEEPEDAEESREDQPVLAAVEVYSLVIEERPAP